MQFNLLVRRFALILVLGRPRLTRLSIIPWGRLSFPELLGVRERRWILLMSSPSESLLRSGKQLLVDYNPVPAVYAQLAYKASYSRYCNKRNSAKLRFQLPQNIRSCPHELQEVSAFFFARFSISFLNFSTDANVIWTKPSVVCSFAESASSEAGHYMSVILPSRQ